jgi:hypothetical protein
MKRELEMSERASDPGVIQIHRRFADQYRVRLAENNEVIAVPEKA